MLWMNDISKQSSSVPIFLGKNLFTSKNDCSKNRSMKRMFNQWQRGRVFTIFHSFVKVFWIFKEDRVVYLLYSFISGLSMDSFSNQKNPYMSWPFCWIIFFKRIFTTHFKTSGVEKGFGIKDETFAIFPRNKYGKSVRIKYLLGDWFQTSGI